MKFIIFIANNIRHGEFPRVDHFEYSQQYEKYLYLGRELTVGEFNDACVKVFSPEFRNQGFTFRPQAVSAELDAQIAADKAEADAALAAAAKEASDAQLKIWAAMEAAELAANPPAETDDGIPASPVAEVSPLLDFRMEGKNIFLGEERIAGLFGEDNQLRIRKESAELRPAIEAWVQTQLSK